MPVDALTRYSITDGEKGPAGGPESAMPVEGVTISDGKDCSADLCATPICGDNNMAIVANKTVEPI